MGQILDAVLLAVVRIYLRVGSGAPGLICKVNVVEAFDHAS